MSNNSETDSEISLSVFYVRSSDEESTPANDRSSKADGPVSTAKLVSTARPVGTARPVSIVRPFTPKIAQTSGAIRPINPRMDNVRPRGSYSTYQRTKGVVKTGKDKMILTLKRSSVARTPQQNGVAERKNRTLIEAARTMLADSLLPIPFWAEAVNTACYYSFMRPFGCPLTILNTLDSLGKFDGKSDEGYLLGYSTSSKAFRVYNKRTKRVEENLHINFLEDQPNVTRTGPNWMFNLDFLTNSMNYIPVSIENQVNMDAGTQDSYVGGSSGKDKGPTQKYILLLLRPHRTRIPVEDVASAAHEKPSESSPKENDVHDSEDVTDKEGQHQMPEDKQVLHDDLENMITQ
ncbi:ribonuclease H-like domain-containing protein [Tanacetum coccineum]